MSKEFKIALIAGVSNENHDLRPVLRKEQDRMAGEIICKVFTGFPTVEDVIVQFAPNLIIVHVDGANFKQAMIFLESLNHVSEKIPVVACSHDFSADTMLQCVKKGIRDFIKHPFDEKEVCDVFNRLSYETRLGHEPTQKAGAVYTFFSYKGGLGTTFLASNTAVALACLTRRRVLLWDMVLQNGDVPFFFDYDPTVTLTDLLENASQIDELYLRGVLPPHSSGVSILACPKRPEEWESIRNDQLQTLVKTLRRYYEYIVIDGGHSLTDQIISLMDHSKNIFLVTDLHLPVLKNTLRCLEIFERLGYPETKFKILLNRFNSKHQKFDLVKAEEVLKYPVSYSICNDYLTVSRSLNAGIPVAELDSSSFIAKQFAEFGRLILNDFKQEQAPKKSLLQNFNFKLPGMKKDKSIPPSKEGGEGMSEHVA